MEGRRLDGRIYARCERCGETYVYPLGHDTSEDEGLCRACVVERKRRHGKVVLEVQR